jgi:hypothetical protein
MVPMRLVITMFLGSLLTRTCEKFGRLAGLASAGRRVQALRVTLAKLSYIGMPNMMKLLKL